MTKLYRLFGLIMLAWLYSSGVGYAQCINAFSFGSVTAPTDNVPVTISTGTWAGDYNTITGLAAGETYEFTSSVGTDYLTVTTDFDVVEVHGTTPVSFTPASAGTYRLHVTVDAACATEDIGRTTTITCTTCPPPPPPPANDDCANAEVIACGGSVTGNTDFATPDTAPTCTATDGSNGVWYKFTGTGDLIQASLCASSYDTQIRVFDGTCGALNCIAGNDDACGSQSEVSFLSTVGTEYLILVHGFEGGFSGPNNGDYQLDITCTVPPPGDVCTDALPIACGGSETGSTVGYGTDNVDFCGTSDGTGGGVWYTFTGTGDLIEASLCNSDFDTKLRIYEGTCGALTCVAGDDDDASCSAGTRSFVSFTSTVGTDYYILVHGFGSSEGDYQLDLTCISCAAPTNLNASNISETQAELSWTAGGTETVWDIEYGAPGFTLGSGTTENDVTNPYTLTGLTAETDYEYYVRADCGGIESDWAGPFAFSTLCPATSTFPFTETFEGASTTRDCWSQEQVTGANSWTFAAGSSGGSITSAFEGSLNARFTSSGGSAEVTRLITPLLDITGLTDPVLTFYYGQEEWFGDQNTLTVYYRISPSDPWVELFSNTDNVADWTSSGRISLPNPSATYQIAFEGTDNFGRANVVDLVEIRENFCPVPTDITTSPSFDAVTIAWTSDADATTWDIEYGTPGFTLGSGTTETGVSNPHTITGLTAETDYEFYIRGNCGGTLGDSEWEGPFAFTTLCPPSSTFPFLETFEDASTTRDCWSQQQVAGENSWTFATGSSGGGVTTAYEGDLNARFTSSSGDAKVTRLISPLMDITSLTAPALKFLYAQEVWAGDQNTLTVYYRASPADSWVQLFTDAGNVADWTCSPVLDLPNPSATYQLAFEGTDNWGRANVLDNILVEDKAPAVAITGGDPATAITNGSTTTSEADGTNFGILSVGLGETSINEFVLRNDGTETLEVSAININAITGGTFTLVAPETADFPISVAPCEEVILQIEAAPTQGGLISATVVVESNVPNFTFQIEAEGIAPRLVMRGGTGSVEIPTGHTTPSTTDGTLFGTVAVGESAESMLTLENAGNEPLTISKVEVVGDNASDFFVTTAPTGTVAAGATPNFNVVFEPTTNGTRTAIIEVYSNDPNNNPYTFTVQGEGTGDDDVTSLSAEVLADLTVYPNPSDGVFKLSIEGNKTSEGVIEVFDTRGSLVYSKKIRLEDGQAEFDLSSVSAGKYTAVIRLGKQQTSRHIIKR